MPDDKNFFAGLFDFSFQYQLTRRLVKLLYIIGILAGGIAPRIPETNSRTTPVLACSVRAAALLA